MPRSILSALALSLALSAPHAAQAQTLNVSECDWQVSARNIPEPWEAHSRAFANGDVRLALMDTIEPAQGWAWLMVLSPPYEEWGGRQCRVIGMDNNGFAGLDFATLRADYDPSVGLMFSVTVHLPNDYGDPRPTTLWFSLNQSTGAINAHLQDG